jgi:hypothetical protein
VRISTISHCLKIKNGEETKRQIQSIFHRKHFQCEGHDEGMEPGSETTDEGGYDDGIFHPSANL